MSTESLATAAPADGATSTPAPAVTAAAPAPAPATTLATAAAPAADPQPQAGEQKPDAATAAGDGKPADEPKADGKPAEEAPQGAPETYEFKPPEGVALSDVSLAAFSDVAKALDLPQDKAQQIVDKVAPAIAAAQAEAAKAFFADIGGAPEGWTQAAKVDKEYGGDAFDQNVAVARKAMEFATPEMKSLLNKTELGNHPEVLRWMYRVGKAMSEDKVVPGKGGEPPPKADTVMGLATSLYR